MIDIHTHLIPNVDDGSRSLEETIVIFKEAIEAGFTDIILTSHYLSSYYEPEVEELVLEKEKLQDALKNYEKKLNLHSGMEIYISEKMEKLIKENKLLTLADSKYMLIELPMNSKVSYFDYVIYYLQTIGIKPIIAHPERYKSVQQDITIVEDFIKQGCLIQCNFGSIIEAYGKEAKKTVKKLLKNDLVHFMASDCHKKGKTYVFIPKAIKKIQKIIGKEKLYEITTLNPRKILNKEEW